MHIKFFILRSFPSKTQIYETINSFISPLIRLSINLDRLKPTIENRQDIVAQIKVNHRLSRRLRVPI